MVIMEYQLGYYTDTVLLWRVGADFPSSQKVYVLKIISL